MDSIVRDPRQWPSFWVGVSDPERIEGDGGPGTEVEFTTLMLGVHMLVESSVPARQEVHA